MGLIPSLVVWLLCGVLAVLLSSRYTTRRDRAPLWAICLGPVGLLAVIVAERPKRRSASLIDGWRDRYFEKHRRTN